MKAFAADALALEHARAELPRECVGLLGDTALWPLRNVAADPRRRFELDPLEVASALAAGFPVRGLYHSHPEASGELAPSAADACPHLGRGWSYWIVDPQRGRVGRWRWTGEAFVSE